MTTKKELQKQEPLLNTVARKLGHAAGTFTKVTKELTGNLSAVPGTLTAKVRDGARKVLPAQASESRTIGHKASSAGRERKEISRVRTTATRKRFGKLPRRTTRRSNRSTGGEEITNLEALISPQSGQSFHVFVAQWMTQ